MPLYTYEHPITSEEIDVIQGMNDKHEYTDEDGVKWKRVFYSPEASIDSAIDPFSSQSFREKTDSTKGTMGDIMDKSKELSQQRKDKLGYDPIQQKYFKDYSKKRRGLKHPQDKS